MVLIHEMEFEVANPLNLQWRDKWYKSWKDYCDNFCPKNAFDVKFNEKTLFCCLKMGKNGNIFQHHAYIVE